MTTVIEAHIKARSLVGRVTTGTVFNLTGGSVVDLRRLPEGRRSIIKKGHYR